MQRDRLMEFVRFCFVGGVSLLFELALLYGLTEFAAIYYLYSSGIAFTIAVIFNYRLCVVYVFRGARHQTPRQAAIFITTSVIGLGLNQLCMWLFVEIIGLYYIIAKLGATVIVTAWNYITKRKALTT